MGLGVLIPYIFFVHSLTRLGHFGAILVHCRGYYRGGRGTPRPQLKKRLRCFPNFTVPGLEHF
jgi:hypothetical protein